MGHFWIHQRFSCQNILESHTCLDYLCYESSVGLLTYPKHQWKTWLVEEEYKLYRPVMEHSEHVVAAGTDSYK